MKNRTRKIFAVIALCAILTLVLSAALFERQASKNIVVNISKRVVAEVGGAVSRIFFKDDTVYTQAFGYENMDAPQLTELRRLYRLDTLVSGAPTELEKMMRLRSWVRKTIPRGAPKNVDYNFNALDVLSRAGKGETFFCSEYATVFVQCALSVGIIGRYVGLFKGHVVAEVWSDQFAKWIVMDVDNDLHYEHNGIPLNALELHRIWEEKKFSEANAVKGMDKAIVGKGEKEDFLSYYHEFYVRMRNDWFSHRYPHWHYRANSIMDSIQWQDEFTKNNILVSRSTRDPRELYFPVNTVSKTTVSGEREKL